MNNEINLSVTDIILKLDMLKNEAKNKRNLGVWIPVSFIDEIMDTLYNLIVER